MARLLTYISCTRDSDVELRLRTEHGEIPPPPPLSPDVSGVVFDTHLKMVMSQGGAFEKMKEKVQGSFSRLHGC